MSLIIENLIYRKNARNSKGIDYNYFLVSLNMADYSSKDKESITGILKVTYWDIKNAIKILEHAGIINVSLGYRKYIKLQEDREWLYDSENAKLTQLRLNPITMWNRELLNMTYLDIERMLSFYNPNKKRNHAVVRYKKNKEVVKEINIPKKFETDLQNINKFLIKKGLREFTYQRVYNCEVKEGIDFDNIKSGDIYNAGYGRCFSSFQQITKENRQLICEELNLKEYDITSCLPNILYTIETGSMYSGDIYNDIMTTLNIDIHDQPEYRDLIKTIFIIMLNVDINNCEKSIRHFLYEENKLNNQGKYNLIPFDIMKTIYDMLPELKNHFFTKSSSLTQFIESRIAIDIMNLMIKEGALPLTIHDAYLFPIDKYDYFVDQTTKIFYNNIKAYQGETSLFSFSNPSYSFIFYYFFNLFSLFSLIPFLIKKPFFNYIKIRNIYWNKIVVFNEGFT